MSHRPKEKVLLLNKQKIEIVDTILQMYPDIQKDRETIINAVLGRTEKPAPYVLEKIQIEDKHYYIDNEGRILDADVTLVGRYKIANGKYIYCLVSELDDIKLSDEDKDIKKSVNIKKSK